MTPMLEHAWRVSLGEIISGKEIDRVPGALFTMFWSSRIWEQNGPDANSGALFLAYVLEVNHTLLQY